MKPSFFLPTRREKGKIRASFLILFLLSACLWLYIFSCSRSQMNQENRYILITSLNLCIFSLILGKCSAVDPQYVACQPINCKNGPKINFPYYIQDEQESYCGYPGFGLNCSEQGFPVLYIAENEYIVEEISYQDHTFQLKNSVFNSTTNNGCVSEIKNISLDKRPFKFVNESRIYLLSKCNESIPEHLLKHKIGFGCGEENRNEWGVAMFAEDESFEFALQVCKNHVMVPVDMLGDEGSNQVLDYQLLLRRGFRLSWSSSDCSECAESGGRCGFDENPYQFKCFCTDRPHSATCRPTTEKDWGLIRGIVFSMFCTGILILLFYFRKKIFWHKYFRFWESEAEDHRNIEAFLKNYGSYAPKRYNYSEVKRITSRFKNKLGQGGFGSVYKGTFPDGSHVAVKVLNELKGSGEEFINEVSSISRTSHVNVVSLVGFCFEGRKRALIYEFMSNGSLEKFIYEERSDNVRKLGWPILYKIALGIARGLEYLHRGCNTRILHFDIKPHNILLDDDFCPKISDFGLAKLCVKKESVVSMLGARGTIGYIAPEIVCRNLGGVSHKSDVYSYGMMVLEMVGGRKNVDVGVDRTSEIYFPHWLYRRIELDEELQLIGITNEEEKECARKMVIMSLWCIQTDPSNRPSMSKVVEMLEGNQDYSLQIPPKPYLYSSSRSEVDSSSVAELR
ncbi:PREDICTED: LEAF RUST 10 DISEASE-RESISTANCE LOCUS RECEPTOR-LIKE PROTEIN KINASE-like 2.1 isoform X2 [Nicotiana attenuata]|uniref:LEAF RUST 10 DISEASE-RESISTANCE LOCUS RECEPTOR-LIKE PROTEIN KINASE-like 2.1 isoform X2 n=1 Tax=Nicotiana attenuata TaxID=49451 RepID=UPI000904918F|nr:PREDICTED: LEAF RUST 10 DISEASE-RESISTANCE LOCUS RECEPTOR-LIKE PROTEIN KINASE-like 2.1 isoform X2 [Nicotiana attenuata]